MDSVTIRLECLRLATANGSCDKTADVDKAEAYYRFVSGDEVKDSEQRSKPQRKS